MSVEVARAVMSRAESRAPSLPIAYLILVLLGWAGGHRWYVGKGGTAIAQFLLMPTGIGLVWWFVDIFLLPGLVEQRRLDLRQDAMLEALTWSTLAGRAA